MCAPRLFGLTTLSLILLAVGAALRVRWAIAETVPPVSDYLEYHRLAANVALHHTYGLEPFAPRVFRPPGWPFALGVAYWVFGVHVQVGAVLGAICSAGAAACGSLVAARLLRPAWATLATGLIALYPTWIAYSSVLGSEHLAGLLLGASVLLLMRRTLDARWAVLLGLLAGALLLTRAEYGLAVAVAALATVVMRRDVRTRVVLPVALAGALVVLAPWWVRNESDFGEFIPTSTNGGVNLYLGTLDTGYTASPVLTRLPPDVTTRPRARDRDYWHLGRVAVQENPWHWLRLDVQRLLVQHEDDDGALFWTGPWAQDVDHHLPLNVYWWGGLALALVGLGTLLVDAIRGRLRILPWVPLLTVLLMGTGLKCFFVVSGRDRLPAVPLLFVVAGYGAQRVARRLGSRAGDDRGGPPDHVAASA